MSEAAYRAAAPGAARGAVLVIHEIFGLTAHIRSVCDRLATKGYDATAPDLFHDALLGASLPYTLDGKQRGLAIKNAIGEAALARELGSWLPRVADGAPVAVMGFCLGGTLAWLQTEAPGVACAVGYYSVGLGRHLDVRPRVPVLMHFGRDDPMIPPDEVGRFRAAHPQVEVHDYDAGHAFNRDDDASYAPAAAALAWQRTLDFLDTHAARRGPP
jgi:carboxymethylenebutenolidase